MTVEKIICDECGRVKAESNHWHRIGIFEHRIGETLTIELGHLSEIDAGIDGYKIHDLCGEQCFLKHICKLLGMGGLDGTTEG